jgi:hypothetical protein
MGRGGGQGVQPLLSNRLNRSQIKMLPRLFQTVVIHVPECFG